MAKRYYLCDVLGNGTENSPYRPAVADLGVNFTVIMPTDPATGKPTSAWCLALVAASNHARVAAAKGVDSLPDVSLDTQWNAADKAKRDAATAALARRGAAVPATSPGDGYRAFLRGVGRQLDGTFSEDVFDVADVSA